MNEEIREAIVKMSEFWQAMAEEASNIAHAKMTLYKAYLSEGFTEEQALVLIMNG